MADGHGGPRPGSGRKPGSPNKVKKAQATYTKVESALLEADIPAFEGDALAFLVWCYKNTQLPIGFRADCARAALPFEKPRLQSTELTGKDGGPILLEQIATAAMAAREKSKPADAKPADVVVH
jgi:hypothetical protein